MTAPYYPTLSPLKTGLACRCPRRGRGLPFKGLLTLGEGCPVCRLDYRKADSGDGPAVFLIFILGALAVGLLFVFQFVLEPPEWLTWLLLITLVLGGALGLPRPAKAIMIALQFRHRVGEFGGGP
ncbi:MAG: DUF983 domain-containing protein [Dongiaceae bacterium]